MPDTIDVTGLPAPVVNDLRRLVNTLRGQDAKNGEPASGTTPVESAEFTRLLDELRIDPTLPPLPAEFSRADIYSNHD